VNGVTYGGAGGGKFVAVGQNGAIAYSTDNGSNWYSSSANTTDIFNGVAYNAQREKFVAVGNGGKIAYSE
jgi:photosystem II stability/assembly factor-like uncharacterized protein